LKALLDEKNTELHFYTPPLEEPLTISGVANFEAHIALDRPDADFAVNLQEVMKDGTVIPPALRCQARPLQSQPAHHRTGQTWGSEPIRVLSLPLVFAPARQGKPPAHLLFSDEYFWRAA